MPLLGVDIGGTFTDFYFLDGGLIRAHKRPSTPAEPARAVIDGIREMGWRPEEVVHGSTVATNTVLERRGARTAFVSSKGFKDILSIGRQARPRLYDLEPSRPPPLVPPELCFEADERLDHAGRVLRPLSRGEAARVADEVARSGAETVAVCTLFSYLRPDHERLLAEALRSRGVDVSASNEVLPEFREYERASTTALNAYVAPMVRGYLRDLESRLKEAGCLRLRVIQSSGGVAAAAQATDLPAALLLSGPAGGVAGAFATARAAGYDNAITFDMGGTSTDVALCPGHIPYTNEWSVSDLPVRLPSVDVHSVGAGGGSVARLDGGGALRVGPRSAGAVPGPACYGRGGPPAVTDAHVVLGRLNNQSFQAAGLAIDEGASTSALQTLWGDAPAAARGVLNVVNASMERALRVVSVQRGFDPRDFTLVAFGGAGPLHACDLASSLSIPRVLVPCYPGILSAIGMALADLTRDAAAPLLATVTPANAGAIEQRVTSALGELGQRLRRDLGAEAMVEAAIDLRNAGQGYEITVPWAGSLTTACEAFHVAHEQRYGHSAPGRVLELTLVRARGRLSRTTPEPPRLEEGGSDPAQALIGRRPVTFEQEMSTRVYDRGRLLAGNRIPGPALVTQDDSTTLIPPAWAATVDERANLILENAGHA